MLLFFSLPSIEQFSSFFFRWRESENGERDDRTAVNTKEVQSRTIIATQTSLGSVSYYNPHLKVLPFIGPSTHKQKMTFISTPTPLQILASPELALKWVTFYDV